MASPQLEKWQKQVSGRWKRCHLCSLVQRKETSSVYNQVNIHISTFLRRTEERFVKKKKREKKIKFDSECEGVKLRVELKNRK